MMRKILGFLSLMLIVLVSCENNTNNKKSNKLYVVTTTQMIADAAQNIAGDQAEVVSLMGPGVDPHFYKATQGDLDKLTKADIIFYNGLHLEGKMQDVLEKFAKRKTVVAVSKDISKEQLLILSKDEEETLYDPHIWHSVEVWKQTLQPIKNTLVSLDKEHSDLYEANTEQYTQELLDLNDRLKGMVDSIPVAQRLLITSHDAFNYFSRNYGIEVKGLQGISTVAEIGIKDITEMVDLIIQRKVKAVFVESSVNERNLKAVVEGCKKKNWTIKIGGTLFSDAMGSSDTPEGTYVGMMTYNTKAIIEALK